MYIYSVQKLSDYLKLSRPTIYRYIDKGMPCSKAPNGRYVFNIEKIEKWVRGE